MDAKLERYKKIYDDRLRTLSFDWRERRRKILLNGEKMCSQKEFARMLNISVVGLNRIERGHLKPSKDLFAKAMVLFDEFDV